MKTLRSRAFFSTLSLVAVALASCSAPEPDPNQAAVEVAQTVGDPLPSWNDGSTKHSIVDFVAQVTTPGGSDFVAEPDRVAVFDNDGTLWAEQPLYFQLLFAFDQIRDMAGGHPEWQTEQPFKAVLENDMQGFAAQGEEALEKVLTVTHSGMTSSEFRQTASDWFVAARHPRYERPYTSCVYQPMLELLDYLRDSGFKTFIVSGGGIEFLRVFAEEVYGIPEDQVVGSSVETEFEIRDGQPVILRTPEFHFVNDKAGKPVGINRYIGQRPIFAFGNSDGDHQMLLYTAGGEGPRFMGLVHHDDAEREYAYDRDSHIGRLDKALDDANTKGWTVVSMKNDWSQILP